MNLCNLSVNDLWKAMWPRVAKKPNNFNSFKVAGSNGVHMLQWHRLQHVLQIVRY